MTHEDFFVLVARMREEQKKYFRTRFDIHLKHSKELERQVDAEIERATAIARQKNLPIQQKLNF
ncbi:MAG: hypothetical protein J6T96_06890 [Bacteroidales bacterium]|jgi:hypothetical protein|nr:hypothetical protein [Bacteroidales bacterium]